MKNNNKLYRLIPIVIVIISSLLFSSCGISDGAVDPGAWGYDAVVTYDALGGLINSREVRETYYITNSYLFRPAGTTNMLIEPVKDGYLLAGWYTTKEDIIDSDGNITGYSFRAQDRWDFDEDRVQGDMTLYARWIPQGRVEYIDAKTNEVMFSKNISKDSTIQPLSGAAENLIAKSGYTFYGYFEDPAGMIPYDFTKYMHQELVPTNREVYDMLYEEFPQYINRVDYIEPSDDAELNPEEDTSDLFFNKLGYEITTDEVARARIRSRKDEIFEEAIQYYEENTPNNVVYLKYEEGSYVRITSPNDLKQAGKYSFSGMDNAGNPIEGYIINNDIDFDGIVLEPGEYGGQILGNGYTLKNISIRVNSRKIDNDTSKEIGIFTTLDGAYIENLTIENMSVTMNVNSGIPVTVGALAAEARNTELKNVQFTDLTIDTGRGDDGAATYRIGDLFGIHRDNKMQNVTGTNITVISSDAAQLDLVLEQRKSEADTDDTDSSEAESSETDD